MKANRCWFWMAALAGLCVPLEAEAVWHDESSLCSGGSCGASECVITCDTTSQYVLFGHIWDDGVDMGYGICVLTGGWPYPGSGTFNGYVAIADPGTNMWTVRLDAADSVNGATDYIALGETGGEPCGTDGEGHAITIKGELPSGDDYTFWGDLGNDYLWMSDNTSTDTPASSDCMPAGNEAFGDGRGGTDVVRGTYYDDELWGETVYGGNGDDIIKGSNGVDYLYGWYGDDTIYGYDGADVIRGQGGADTIYGGADADTLYGDAGIDTIFGEGGNDDIYGGADDDFLYGGDNNDEIHGEAYCDTIDGDGGYNYCWCDESTASSEPYDDCQVIHYCIDADACLW